MEYNNKPKLQVGSIWHRTSQNGFQYMSGTLKRAALEELLAKTNGEDLKVNIWMNKNKANPKAPDYKIMSQDVEYVAPERKQANSHNEPMNFGEPPQFNDSDSIPF